MRFLKIKEKEYLSVAVVGFSSWNRVFERCMHILRTDMNMPCYEELIITLLFFLQKVFPPDDINCNPHFTEADELELADKFLSSCLSFLIDTEV